MARLASPASLGVSSFNILTMTDWPGLGIVSPLASNVPGQRGLDRQARSTGLGIGP